MGRAGRRRRRLEEEQRRLGSLEQRGTVHTRCSDVTLSELDGLVAATDELLGGIAAHAEGARRGWPEVPAAYELRATVEELAVAAAFARTRLAAARERSRRLRLSGVHVHMCGALAVRMVPLVTQVPAVSMPHVDTDTDDDDDALGALEIDEEIPF